MNNSRIKNTKRNIIASYLSTFLTLAFSFVSRTLMIKIFGGEYLGLSSLFSSILQVLNMAELGFSGAIVYNMYKPLSENDTETVCALLNYYRKIYRIVGSIVFIVGISLMPFLPYLITGDVPNDVNLYLLYLLYLINTAVTYFMFAYKNSLLEAVQRLDLIKVISTVNTFIIYILQFISLLVLHNYYMFVIIQIIGSIIHNVLVAVISNKKFPQYQCRGRLEAKTKKDISTRVKGLLICKISGVTYTTFDSIIISAFIGLTTVAVYNNYLTIFNIVCNLIIMIRTAMQASVGNSIASESIEKNYEDMQIWQFAFSFIATISMSCLICLFQPFMIVWMGKDMLLDLKDVLLFGAFLVLNIIPHSYYLYLTGKGLWWELRLPYIFSTIFNLICNIVLGRLLGVTGIILSTVLANFIFGFIWQCSIVFKHYFHKSPRVFFLTQFKYFGVTILVGFITYFTCSWINIAGILGLVIRAIVCILLSFGLCVLIYFRTEIFRDSFKFLKRVLKA